LECANSVIAQNAEIEWIVVDDNSLHEAITTYKEVLSAFPHWVKIKFIQLNKQIGLSACRNAGIAHSNGDWVIILDSDDRLNHNIVDTLVNLPYETLMVCFDVIYFNDNFHEYRKVYKFGELFKCHAGTTLDPFLWYDFYYHGIIARRKLMLSIGCYSEELRVGEDQDVLLRATEAIEPHQLNFVYEPMYEYRCNPAGVCATYWADVLANYTRTMLAGARRRGSSFIGCRHAGTEIFDGVEIDTYEYLASEGHWYSWHEWFKKSINVNKVLL
jgi:glycosyltransferase involved in cell wall biosynthesis